MTGAAESRHCRGEAVSGTVVQTESPPVIARADGVSHGAGLCEVRQARFSASIASHAARRRSSGSPIVARTMTASSL